MTDTTKPDLSREAVEHIASCVDGGDLFTETEYATVAATLRALLDRAEAAERELGATRLALKRRSAELTEARASAAAAWEAGRDAAAEYAIGAQDRVASTLTNPDPSATEALSRVKEAAWDEGHHPDATTNPYAAKEAAHG